MDVRTPGDSYAETAVAALAGGKHVLYEKPLANTAPEPSFTGGPQVQRVLAAADSTADSVRTPIGGS